LLWERHTRYACASNTRRCKRKTMLSTRYKRVQLGQKMERTVNKTGPSVESPVCEDPAVAEAMAGEDNILTLSPPAREPRVERQESRLPVAL